jgi:uncharacterized protein YjdB
MRNLYLTLLALLFSYSSFAVLPITGSTSFCVGSSTTLSDATPAGTWSSGDPTVATVGLSTGVVTGVAIGTAVITYDVSGIYVTTTVTVLAIPAPITGASSLCAGMTTAMSDATPGGVWSCAVTPIAVFGSTNILAGTSPGTATITYTLGGCSATKVMTVLAVPPPVTGPAGVCIGGTVTVSDAATGGVWSSSNSLAATVSSGGVVTGVGAGTSLIYYTIPTGCSNYKYITVTSTLTSYTVSGGGGYCSGGSGYNVILSGSDVGTNYQLYNGSSPVGSIVAGTGSVLNFGMQTTAGIYTVVGSVPSGCMSTMAGSATISVYPLPVVYTVTGGGSYCAGGAGMHIYLTFSDVSTTYRLYLGGVAIGGTLLGIGAALDFGLQTAAGTYTVAATDAVTGCMDNMSGPVTITIDPVPASISGASSVCIGGTTAFSDATLGGTWSSSSSNAVIGSTTGIATGVSAGMANISYVLPTGCAATTTVTVDALPAITASSTPSSCGDTYTLTAGGGLLYSWAPSTGLSCATCATATVSPAATTTYTVMGTDANGCSDVNTVTINGDRIFGHITFGSITPDTLDMKVWLVQYNPIDSSITALDSVATCVVDSITYYEFDGKPSGNYLVKAKLLYGNPIGSSGYVPTYGLSTPNWYAASGITHAGGSDSMHITMVYGTVPPGPGFIGGYVYSGAGKGTSGDLPVTGMMIYLQNTSTKVLTYTYTDSKGAYAFNNLAYGAYVIYPEDYNYHTTPSAVINVSSGAPSANGMDFKQYTTSKKIMPFDYTLIRPVDGHGIGLYPNPSNGVINLQWSSTAAETAEIQITDVLGNKVFTSLVSRPVVGKTQLDLGQLQNGIYFVTIRANNVTYNSKMLIQK